MKRQTTQPTSEQIARARSELDAVIAFFEQRRRSLDAPPAADDGEHFAGGRTAFDLLLEDAKTNPALARALGVQRKRRRQRERPAATSDDERRAQELCDLINYWI